MDRFVFKCPRTEEVLPPGLLDKDNNLTSTTSTTLHQEEDEQGAASSTCQRREEDDEQGEEEMEQEMEQERDLLHQPPPATEPVTNVSHANKSSATSDISQRPGDGPQRPIRQNYPSRLIGTVTSKDLLMLPGLTHTASLNIRLEWTQLSASPADIFWVLVGTASIPSLPFLLDIKIGRTPTAAFKKHNGSLAHRFAMEAWAEFKLATKDGSRLGNMIDAGHSRIVQENCEYMRAVVVSLRYTACQGITQRGHREDEGSGNKGNFVKLLNMIGETVAKKLIDNARNAKYTHKDI